MNINFNSHNNNNFTTQPNLSFKDMLRWFCNLLKINLNTFLLNLSSIIRWPTFQLLVTLILCNIFTVCLNFCVFIHDYFYQICILWFVIDCIKYSN